MSKEVLNDAKAVTKEPRFLNDVFNAFFEMATAPAQSTPIVVGLCGELMGGYASEHGALLYDCSMVQTGKDEEVVIKHLNTHGGCDTAMLKGHLFIKDGKLCLIATEE